MAASTISVEWLNQNSLRNYPFREDAGLRPNDSTGALIEDGWRLPNYLVVDFAVCTSGADYSPILYLSRLSLVGDIASMTFSDENGEAAFAVGFTATDTAKAITGTGSFADCRGVIRFGDVARFFDETPEGAYSFSLDETLIEPSCIRPSAVGVRSIATKDASGYLTGGLMGDVKLVAGENVNIKYDVESNALIISADPNSGYTDECPCAEDDGYFVRTINGINTEDVTLEGDDCFDISVENGVIKIRDKCSKPCCGCAEVTFINNTVNMLKSSTTTLERNVDILSDRVNSFVNNYLLARKTLV